MARGRILTELRGVMTHAADPEDLEAATAARSLAVEKDIHREEQAQKEVRSQKEANQATVVKIRIQGPPEVVIGRRFGPALQAEASGIVPIALALVEATAKAALIAHVRRVTGVRVLILVNQEIQKEAHLFAEKIGHTDPTPAHQGTASLSIVMVETASPMTAIAAVLANANRSTAKAGIESRLIATGEAVLVTANHSTVKVGIESRLIATGEAVLVNANHSTAKAATASHLIERVATLATASHSTVKAEIADLSIETEAVLATADRLIAKAGIEGRMIVTEAVLATGSRLTAKAVAALHIRHETILLEPAEPMTIEGSPADHAPTDQDPADIDPLKAVHRADRADLVAIEAADGQVLGLMVAREIEVPIAHSAPVEVLLGSLLEGLAEIEAGAEAIRVVQGVIPHGLQAKIEPKAMLEKSEPSHGSDSVSGFKPSFALTLPIGRLESRFVRASSKVGRRFVKNRISP